jgi:hypothetical protein
MVRRRNDKIGYWHASPNTQEELEDFWRRYGRARARGPHRIERRAA